MMTSWTCEKCGLTLANAKPPVRHNCPGKPVPRKIAPPRSERMFVTTDQLVRDTLSLAPKLPKIDCVVGIARSGLIPASVLATHLGADLWSIDYRTGDLLDLGHGMRHESRGRDGVLLVDDSCWSGTAIRAAKRRIVEAWGVEPLTLSTYVRPQSQSLVDLWAASYPEHWFSWNICNAPYIESVAFDLDGVMCRDFHADEDDDGERYLAAMESMRPTHHRPRKPIKIITARLEKYREPTEAWLARHGIPIDELVMGPWVMLAERQALGNGLWDWKAREAKRLGVAIMVESSRVGAARIAEAAGIWTIATDDGSTHGPRSRPKLDIAACVHRGELLETITCRGCGGAKQVDVFACAIHGRSHQVPANDHRAGMSCRACAMADEGFKPLIQIASPSPQ